VWVPKRPAPAHQYRSPTTPQAPQVFLGLRQKVHLRATYTGEGCRAAHFYDQPVKYSWGSWYLGVASNGAALRPHEYPHTPRSRSWVGRSAPQSLPNAFALTSVRLPHTDCLARGARGVPTSRHGHVSTPSRGIARALAA